MRSSLVQTAASLAIAFYLTPGVSATPTPDEGVSTRDLVDRQSIAAPPCSYPFTSFVYSGCYADPSSPRALPFSDPSLNTQNMTVELCVASCKANGYRYAGLEYYGECFCGASVAGTLTSQSQCSYPCTGNKSETCGGSDILSVYQDPTFQTTNNAIISDYQPLGCYTEGVGGRALIYQQNQLNTASLTTEQCLSTCKAGGYPFAGTEYAGQCFCGVVLGNGTVPTLSTDCNMPCSGNSSETCGGPSRLNLYVAKDLQSCQPCGANVQPPPSIPVPVSINGYVSQGCYTDSINSRGLIGPNYHGPSVTLESCSAFCKGWTYFSVENGWECYCGNAIQTTSVPAASSSCSSKCPGNATETCGGFGFMTVYQNPTASNPPTIGGYAYQGCYTDGISARGLTGPQLRSASVSLETCATFCTGFSYFGVENQSECYCGNVIQTSSKPSTNGCESTCVGNPNETCGGFGRITIYGNPTAIAATPPPVLSGYTYQGCYTDKIWPRGLNGPHTSGPNITLETCADFCLGHVFFGVENSNECYCGNYVQQSSIAVPSKFCTSSCVGNTKENCGGFGFMNVYGYLPWIKCSGNPGWPW